MRMRTAKIIDRSVLLAATLGLVAKQYEVPSHAFWLSLVGSRGYVVIAMVGIISVFGAFAPFEAMSARSRVERRSAIRQQILAHYGRLLVVAGQAVPPVEISDLGLHVWRKRRTFRYPWPGRLHRIATYRLGTTPATRPFTPAPGVGVVGLCWQGNREYGADVEALSRAVPDEATFNQYRDANGAESVMGFTWPEFKDVRHRGAVFAGPIRDGAHRFVGCVSVDASRGYSGLDNPDLWYTINSLCSVLGQDGLRNV